MENLHMILDEKHNMIPVDGITWAEWFEKNHSKPIRVVKQEMVGKYFISTVFLGLDHNFFGGGKPLWFESMIFNEKDKKFHNYQDRYETWEESEKGHQKMVAMIRKAKKIKK